jgi:hypothetical protein
MACKAIAGRITMTTMRAGLIGSGIQASLHAGDAHG